MDQRLYEKSIVCPVCSKPSAMTKVKSRGCKVLERESDFFVKYEDLNPLMYEVWVCENCGYAALQDKFENISKIDSKAIAENISKKWKKRSYNGERSIDTAIETFKLALLNLQVRKAKSSEIAKVCLRLAWLYRLKKDENEKNFLKFALKGYNEAFEHENFPIDKFDEFTCMYMIGELNRRLGNIDEATKWFSRIISSPEARKNNLLMNMTRDQFQLTKDQLKTKEG